MFFFIDFKVYFTFSSFAEYFCLKNPSRECPVFLKSTKIIRVILFFLGEVGPRDLFPLSVNVVVPSYRREEREDVL